MWIEKTANGFKAVQRYTDPMTGKSKRVSVSIEKNTSATRKLAEKILQEKIEKKILPKKTSITLQELVEAWLQHQRQNVKESSYITCNYSSRSILKVLGADCLVDSLSARYINLQVNKYYEKPSSQNNVIKIIKAVLVWGYDNDYIDDISWLSKLKARKDERRKAKLSDKYLEKGELDILINAIEEPKWKELTLFLALTGMRIGEALALEYTDINLKERLISVTKTYNDKTKKPQSAKTADSIRDVYIQDELLPVCIRIKNKASQSRFISPLVFSDCKFNTYYKNLNKTCLSCLNRTISPHVLRHTHVALLAENGVPLEVISRRLGHKSTAITKDIYFHVTSNLKEKDNMAIKGVSIM